MDQRKIVVVGFEGCTALDLVSAADTFNTARYLHPQHPYEVSIVSIGGAGFGLQAAARVIPERALESVESVDTLILPGGIGLRDPATAQPIAEWIRANEPSIRRIASVCTGLFGLAATGLLDGRRAATHWRFAQQLSVIYPKVEVDADAIFIRDGKYYTSAGVTAGIDLALGLIEEDLGPAAALAVARELVVYVKRPGGQQQFSDVLRFQTVSVSKIREVVEFVQANIDHDLSVEQLACQAGTSPRNFSRLFRKSLGMPPAEFVECARLGEATRRLTETSVAIEQLAPSVGYRSADAFSRAFRRRFGIAPTEYRDRFSSAAMGANGSGAQQQRFEARQ